MMEAAKCMFCFWYEWFHISKFVFETIFNCIDKTNEHNFKGKKPGYDFNNVNAKKKPKQILKQLHNFNIIILFNIYPKYESIFMNV